MTTTETIFTRGEEVRTVSAAHDDFVHQLPVRNVDPAIEERLLFLFPVEVKHPPQQLFEQAAVRDTALDSNSCRQP